MLFDIDHVIINSWSFNNALKYSIYRVCLTLHRLQYGQARTIQYLIGLIDI